MVQYSNTVTATQNGVLYMYGIMYCILLYSSLLCDPIVDPIIDPIISVVLVLYYKVENQSRCSVIGLVYLGSVFTKSYLFSRRPPPAPRALSSIHRVVFPIASQQQ